jgi:hypothetical protein
MFNEDQRLYLEDVLGVSSAGMSLAGTPEIPLLVLTSPLNSEEQSLLIKILGSVSLGLYEIRAVEKISLGECPPELNCGRVLAFADYPTGAHNFAEGHWTVLPTIASMTGTGAEVTARKKEAWTLLQKFVKEMK